MGGKDGGKHKVISWVGVTWNWETTVPKPKGVVPQYSIAIFTEDWSEDSAGARTSATTIIPNVMANAIPFLADSRPRRSKR